MFSNEQVEISYTIGLSSGDIGDYAEPSAQVYSNIFNQTGLTAFVHLRSIPRNSNEISLDDDQLSNLPFFPNSNANSDKVIFFK